VPTKGRIVYISQNKYQKLNHEVRWHLQKLYNLRGVHWLPIGTYPEHAQGYIKK
jgi:hypothetical protein